MGMTWAYGEAERDEAESIATIHRALDIGVTLLDTADMYGPYTNEELVGRAIAGPPRRGRPGHQVRARGRGRGRVRAAQGRPPGARARGDRGLAAAAAAPTSSTSTSCTASIPRCRWRRPGARWPSSSPQGKVGALGLSEVSVDELERAHAIHPVASVQSEGSLWTRDAFAEVVPWCAAHGAAFLPFAPLGPRLPDRRADAAEVPARRLPQEQPALPARGDGRQRGAGRAREGGRRAPRRDAGAGRARVAARAGRARRPDPGHQAPLAAGGERRGGGAARSPPRTSRSSTRSPRPSATGTRSSF